MSKSGLKWIDNFANLIVRINNQSPPIIRNEFKERITSMIKPSLNSFDFSLSRLYFMQAADELSLVIESSESILLRLNKVIFLSLLKMNVLL